MLLFIATVVAVLGFGSTSKHGKCRRMSLKQLCETPEGHHCREYIPDSDHVCRQVRINNQKVSILSSERVPYWDASEPEIIHLTLNQTVAPDGRFEIRCMAEGAPAPFIEIQFREDADLRPFEGGFSNAADIEKRAVQTVYSQTYAIYEDEGWYRCVAKNNLGVAYMDTYLTVASELDLCATIQCPEGKICEVNFDTGEPECLCPYCTWEDYEKDQNLYCATDCSVYFSKCSIVEEQCQGRNIDIFHNGQCGDFTLPDYSYMEPQQTELEYGDRIELTCGGVPAGANPGPDPLIMWYQDWGSDMGGREAIGVGNTISYVMELNTAHIICVGVHCPGSREKKRETDINHFVLAVPFDASSPTPASTAPFNTPERISTTGRNGIRVSTTAFNIPTTPLPVTEKANGGAVCQIMGDPTISTFDGKWYKQDGVCTYVLAMDCQFAQWFVYGRFTQFGDISSLETVTVYYGGQALELQRGWIINNHGEKLAVKVGEVVQFGVMEYIFDGEYITLSFGEGNEVRWNGFNGAQVITGPTSRTCGICGNNNGSPDDDFVSRYRKQLTDEYQFVSTWGLRQHVACHKNEAELELSVEAMESCSALFFDQYILKCHDVVPVADYEMACARAVASNTYPTWRAECNLLQSYVLQCETRGLNMSKWRERTSCTTLEEMQQFTIDNGCPQDNPPV